MSNGLRPMRRVLVDLAITALVTGLVTFAVAWILVKLAVMAIMGG